MKIKSLKPLKPPKSFSQFLCEFEVEGQTFKSNYNYYSLHDNISQKTLFIVSPVNIDVVKGQFKHLSVHKHTSIEVNEQLWLKQWVWWDLNDKEDNYKEFDIWEDKIKE